MGNSSSGLSRKRRTLPRQQRPGWLQRMDQRSSVARQLHERLAGIADDQGGMESMSVIQRSLVERFIHAEALAVQIETAAAAGKPFDTGQYLAIVDRVARLGQVIGTQRRAKPAVNLHEYMAGKSSGGVGGR